MKGAADGMSGIADSGLEAAGEPGADDRFGFIFERWARYWLPPGEETGDRRADVGHRKNDFKEDTDQHRRHRAVPRDETGSAENGRIQGSGTN